MKLSKTTLLSVLLIGALGTLSNFCAASDTPPPPPPPAQDGGHGRGPGKGGPGMGAKDRLKMLAEELNLTEDQKQKLEPILKKEAEELKAIRKNEDLSREEKFAKAQAVHQSYKPQIHALLTPEQIAKLEELQKNRPGFGGDRPGRRERKGDRD